MARVRPTNPAFRTKSEIVRDLTKVLNSDLHRGTKLAVVDNAAWAWTCIDGKYEGCRYWTSLALAAKTAGRKKEAELRHEHVVPRAVIRRMLFALDPVTEDAVRDICEQFLIGVVVTLGEDVVLNVEFPDSMPDDFDDPKHEDFQNPWLRYQRCPLITSVVDLRSPSGHPT